MRAAVPTCALLFALGASAAAQAPAEESRDALLERAAAARDAGDHDAALELARRAGAIAMTPSLRLFMAQQQALTGRVPDAVTSAEACVDEASGDPALSQRETILATCREIVRRLRPEVARITVHIADPPPGTAVEVNGRTLPPERWERPLVVFPGDVRVVARTPGATVRQRVRLAAGAETTVELRFDVAASGARATGSEGDRDATAVDPAWLALPIGLAVAAGAATAVTGALVLDRGAAYDALVPPCAGGDTSACDRAAAARSDGEGFAIATNVLLGAALAATAAAAITALFVDVGEGRALVSRHGVGVRF